MCHSCFWGWMKSIKALHSTGRVLPHANPGRPNPRLPNRFKHARERFSAQTKMHLGVVQINECLPCLRCEHHLWIIAIHAQMRSGLVYTSVKVRPRSFQETTGLFPWSCKHAHVTCLRYVFLNCETLRYSDVSPHDCLLRWCVWFFYSCECVKTRKYIEETGDNKRQQTWSTNEACRSVWPISISI